MFIQIPDLSAVELVRLANEKLGLTSLCPDLALWDFIRDERGKFYESLVWEPDGLPPIEEARSYLRVEGFTGNTAAFVVWLIQTNPEGFHISIPEDDRLFRDTRGNLLAPRFFRFEDQYADLHLFDIHDGLDALQYPGAFVAFREG